MTAVANAPQTTSLAPVTPPLAGVGPQPWRWTREQYYKLYELGFFQDKRVELIHGEIVAMSPMGWPHSLALGNVRDVLSVVFAAGHWLSEQRPFPMPGMLPATEPEPDLAVIVGSRRSFRNHPTTAALIVEVSDATLFFDTTTKAELYATANVPEYWVLDLGHRQLLVFRDPVQLPAGLGATAYRTHLTLGSTESINPLAAPTATVRVTDLLPGLEENE